jgi:hypothetical protein
MNGIESYHITDDYRGGKDTHIPTIAKPIKGTKIKALQNPEETWEVLYRDDGGCPALKDKET